MLRERKVCYSALFTNLVSLHTDAVSFPQVVILAQLACPPSDNKYKECEILTTGGPDAGVEEVRRQEDHRRKKKRQVFFIGPIRESLLKGKAQYTANLQVRSSFYQLLLMWQTL
jgi:hypothetical protein